MYIVYLQRDDGRFGFDWRRTLKVLIKQKVTFDTVVGKILMVELQMVK